MLCAVAEQTESKSSRFQADTLLSFGPRHDISTTQLAQGNNGTPGRDYIGNRRIVRRHPH
jgi:hypothetical protein